MLYSHGCSCREAREGWDLPLSRCLSWGGGGGSSSLCRKEREPTLISHTAPGRTGSFAPLMGMENIWAALWSSAQQPELPLPLPGRNLQREPPSQRWFALARATRVGQISTNSYVHFNLEMSQVLQGTHPSEGHGSDLLWFLEPEKWRRKFLHRGFQSFCYFPHHATEGSKWTCAFIFYWTSKLVMCL